jgi:hypothetical protein
MSDKTDISVRGLLIGAAIVLGGIALALGAAALVSTHVSAPATGPSTGQPPKIEGPALQTAPAQDLKAFLREKNERLNGSGRVDAGHVHIPIERAMQILANGRAK